MSILAGIHAYGIDDETPFSFSSARPGVSFHWSASNMDVLSLASHYDKAGVSLQEEQDFGAFLRTRNPGQGIIRVTATCHPGACIPEGATFSDHLQVHCQYTVIHEFFIVKNFRSTQNDESFVCEYYNQ